MKTTEQFEQAKREFAEKWEMDLHRKKILLSDLTALLEQHKEVIKEELRQKLFSMRSTKKTMDMLSKEDRLITYGYHDCINEMLMWTKNNEI